MTYFVSAINTDSGKTLVAAILCRALGADYWKPIQAGTPTDAETVTKLTSGRVAVHPERYRLKMPASPHQAARAENIQIRLDDFELPLHEEVLVVEGAGGVLVPINETNFVIDLAQKFKSKVILVSNIYLGSINHTLLSFEALKSRHIEIEGIVFNGPENKETERIILQHTGLPLLLHIKQEDSITPEIVDAYAHELRSKWTSIISK